MLVSIIIANYNYGKYLGRCIRSCLNQSLSERDYEIILVDDFSNDNSIKIANEYSKFINFKIIKNAKNLGVAISANKGFKAAKGKFVVRVDSDDYVTREFLNILSYYLLEYPEILSVSCDYYLVDEKEKKIRKVSSKENPVSCGIMYNKTKLLKLGAYNKTFKHREEEELRIRIGKKYETHHLNIPLYRYRMHASNKTKDIDYQTVYKDKIGFLNFSSNYKKIKSREKKLKKNIIAIIPARGGSKRLKNKNMLKIWGKPMIYWTINEAKKSSYIKNVYVSSENTKIINYAKNCGAKIIKRKKSLSGDKVFKMSVIADAIKKISKYSKPSLVLSLQANSPNISHRDIDKAIEQLIKFNRNEIISVDENYNQNGAIRAMKASSVFQKSLSTDCGFIVTNIADIHTSSDIKKLKKMINNRQ